MTTHPAYQYNSSYAMECEPAEDRSCCTLEDTTKMFDKHQYTNTKKNRRATKSVRFSEMSSMVCYEDQTSGMVNELFYSPQDVRNFKRDAVKAASAIHTSIASSQLLHMEANKHKAPLWQYTQVWQDLPHLLEAHGIDESEAVGIEHLCIGKPMVAVALALRRKYSTMIIEEQQRYQFEHKVICDPQVFAELSKPFTKVSTFVARERAWMNAATR